ncbi:hypothetical protein ABEG18_05430 [Alsobacter sp. KACC 23698]|uniref:Uncharacterized protein n=1 Tax=Alsobacter sp. KACC 23698 TaxID=3149229 RepID=A0AAU7JIK7_9HYPH
MTIEIIPRALCDRLLAASDAQGDRDLAIAIVGPDLTRTETIEPGCYLVAEYACGHAIYHVDTDLRIVRPIQA